MAELKGRRERFCHEYLLDLHGGKAAMRAGYAESVYKSHPYAMRAEAEIQARIAELAAGRREDFKVEAREVLLELHRMLTANVADALDERGCLKSIHDMPLAVQRMIASIEVEEIFAGKGEDRQEIGRLKKVKFWSKEKGAELLGRHLALFNDKLKLEGGDDLAERILAGRNRQAPLV